MNSRMIVFGRLALYNNRRRLTPITTTSIRASSGDDHHHDAVPDHGPGTTMDEVPVPIHPYAKVHAELQHKYNQYLAIGIALFVASACAGWYTNTFTLKPYGPPDSYRYRKIVPPA